jgi:spermidine synthase
MGLRDQVRVIAADPRRRLEALGLMAASGFAGLGYQIVWTRQCALWLGHESAAVLAVLTAFFGGVALGAWSLGPGLESTRHPGRWYAGCELVIAAWSLALLFLMPWFSGRVLALTGAQPSPAWQWLVAFAATFLLFLPATAAMGATLPALERLTAPAPTRSIGALYAANTAGAVVGVLAAALWLIPAVGLRHTALACAALNLICGLTSLAVFRTARPPPVPASSPAPAVMVRLAATGLLGIGYEVLVVRVLGQVTENTVYTFALLLVVYLMGSAAGATALRRWLARRPRPERLCDTLLAALAAACLLGTASLWAAKALRILAQHALGNSALAALVSEAIPALIAFGPATMVMGALFSELADQASRSGVTFGRALAVNTLGATAAPALFGVVLFPTLGAKLALLLIPAGYVALGRHWPRALLLIPALALALFAPPLAFITVPAGGRVVFYKDGAMASASVVEDAGGVAQLRINDRQQEGSSATRRVDGRQAWLPLLLHPAPRSALFLGLGTGVTASSAADDPTLAVDAVELLPEVVAASARFIGAPARLHVITADARRYVRASPRRYDVIVSDNFHPARSGSGSLYTVEHFQSVARRLEEGGVFCQWLPLHQLDLQTLRSVVQSFLAAFARPAAIIASNSLETPVLGLIGRPAEPLLDPAAVRARLTRAPLAGLGLEDELAVLGSFIAGPRSLRRFAGKAMANTDDLPLVAYRAPLITYAPEGSPRDRLMALLGELTVEPAELLTPASGETWARRLGSYWRARNRFIEAGRDVRPSPRVAEMLAQVRDPLLSVLRISPDFRPAYDPLLSMAASLARSDSTGARILLGELMRLQPARPEAPRALALIDAR